MTSQVKRVVSLVDMDCFYVQVAQRKDPSLKGKPCAVVQYNAWQGGGIIAVGYEARKFGVTRQMRGKQAKEKCPDIILVPVPESRGKADLTQFREAGAEVIEILADFTDCLERASIDEAYMDLTNTINKTIDNYTVEEVALYTFKTTHIIGLENIEVDLTEREDVLKCDLFRQWKNTLENNIENYHLAIGAVIADKMRKAVVERTGFSCSAGVGPNKMLAKVVAGFHKPSQQTLILPQNVDEMFQTTKLRKIRSLGGKVGGQLIDKFKMEYMSELVSISLQDLQTQIGGKNGELVYWLCRGIDHEPVRPRQLPKSVGCSKNFRGFQKLSTKADVHKWLTNLAEEIMERLDKEKEQNHRVATLFTVGCLNELDQSQSRKCTVVRRTLSELRDEAFRVLLEFNKTKTNNDWHPAITNLHLNASKFQTISTPGSNTINSYMSVKTSDSNTHDDIQRISIDNSNEMNSLKCKSPRKKSISNFFAVAERKMANKPKTATKVSTELTERSIVSFKDYYGPGGCKNTIEKTQESKLVPSLTPRSISGKEIELSRSNLKDDNTLPESPLPIGNNSPEKGKNASGSNLFSRFCRTTSERTEKSMKGKLDESENVTSSFSSRMNQGTENLTVSNSRNVASLSSNGFENIKGKISSENRALRLCEDSDNNIRTSNYSSTINDLMICDKCGKRMLAWDLPDHMDFHFAKDLQDSLKNDFLNLYNTNNSRNTIQQPSSSRPLKRPPKKKSRLENSVVKYFSPVKK